MSRKTKAWTEGSRTKEVEVPPQSNSMHGGVTYVPTDDSVAVEEPPPPPPVPRPLSHEEDPYLTQSEAAERLGVSAPTIKRWLELGPSNGGLAGEWRSQRICIRESALAAFQGKNYVPPIRGGVMGSKAPTPPPKEGPPRWPDGRPIVPPPPPPRKK